MNGKDGSSRYTYYNYVYIRRKVYIISQRIGLHM